MRKRGRPASPGLLTPREREVLDFLRAGRTNPEIGELLGISVETVKQCVSEILSKLGVATREEAAAWQPEPERRWSFGRILLALAGTAVVAAAVAGLALLAWGVSQSGEEESQTARVTGTIRASPIGNQTLSPTQTGSSPSPAPSIGPLPAVGDSLRLDQSSADISFFHLEDLYVEEGVGGLLHRLPSGVDCGTFLYSSIGWSPDGSRLYCTGQDAPASAGVFVMMDTNGAAVARVNSPELNNAEWSPDSQKLLYFREGKLIVVDRDLHQLAEFGDGGRLDQFYGYSIDGSVHWSPDSKRIAYYSEAADETRMISVDTLSQMGALVGYRPLGWLDDHTLVVGQGTWNLSLESFDVSYQAATWDAETESLTRLPSLDCSSGSSARTSQLWFIPQLRKAVSPYQATANIGLKVIDIDSGSTTEIVDSRIGYPSEGIPPRLVWLLGDVLYWECVCDGSSIQRTPLSSLVAEDVASRPLPYMVASPDGVSIAYVTYDQDFTARLFSENPDGSGKMQLAVQQPKLSGVGASMPFAWRLTPAH